MKSIFLAILAVTVAGGSCAGVQAISDRPVWQAGAILVHDYSTDEIWRDVFADAVAFWNALIPQTVQLEYRNMEEPQGIRCLAEDYYPPGFIIICSTEKNPWAYYPEVNHLIDADGSIIAAKIAVSDTYYDTLPYSAQSAACRVIGEALGVPSPPDEVAADESCLSWNTELFVPGPWDKSQIGWLYPKP